MSNNMKMRAQLKGGLVEVKVLMSHPMETGRKKDDFDKELFLLKPNIVRVFAEQAVSQLAKV